MEAGSNQRPEKSELDIIVESLQVYSDLGVLSDQDREKTKLLLAKIAFIYAYRNLLTEDDRLGSGEAVAVRKSVSLVIGVNEKQ